VAAAGFLAFLALEAAILALDVLTPYIIFFPTLLTAEVTAFPIPPAAELELPLTPPPEPPPRAPLLLPYLN